METQFLEHSRYHSYIFIKRIIIIIILIKIKIIKIKIIIIIIIKVILKSNNNIVDDGLITNPRSS